MESTLLCQVPIDNGVFIFLILYTCKYCKIYGTLLTEPNQEEANNEFTLILVHVTIAWTIVSPLKIGNKVFEVFKQSLHILSYMYFIIIYYEYYMNK